MFIFYFLVIFINLWNFPQTCLKVFTVDIGVHNCSISISDINNSLSNMHSSITEFDFMCNSLKSLKKKIAGENFKTKIQALRTLVSC